MISESLWKFGCEGCAYNAAPPCAECADLAQWTPGAFAYGVLADTICALRQELMARTEAHEEAERRLFQALCLLLDAGAVEVHLRGDAEGGWVHRSAASTGRRDPFAPCDYYAERTWLPYSDAVPGDCRGDGHYLCRHCCSYAPWGDGQ